MSHIRGHVDCWRERASEGGREWETERTRERVSTRERESTRERGASVAITDPTTCSECTVLCKHFLHPWPKLESEACTERNVDQHVHDELRDYSGALDIYGAVREGKGR